ncbi:SphA family protein [Bosea sp. 2RAB26]|uniref:SphA family protein n=1 Tax=Bosea sp. 2RAB26 TaxID=3237476 RepID=UPI003F8EE825
MLRGEAKRTALGLRTACALVAAGVAACWSLAPHAAQAAENGTGFYLLGGRGPMAGYLPPPGFYFESDTYSYDAKLDARKSLPTGGRVIANVRSQARADFLNGTWVTPWQAFGGNLAVGAVLPVGRVTVSAGVELDSPRTNTVVGRSLRDKATIVGDPVLSATLGWHSGKFHWSTTALVNVPVGDYRNGQLANLAFHRWASDLSGALTWFDPETGIDLSTAVGVTFNGTNHATDYRTGTEFHVEWAASKAITSAISAGIIGYHYQQVTGDSGAGAQLGAYKGRTTALGGTIAYNFEIGKTPISARIKVLREFSVENRARGTVGLLTVSLPLTASR